MLTGNSVEDLEMSKHAFTGITVSLLTISTLLGCAVETRPMASATQTRAVPTETKILPTINSTKTATPLPTSTSTPSPASPIKTPIVSSTRTIVHPSPASTATAVVRKSLDPELIRRTIFPDLALEIAVGVYVTDGSGNQTRAFRIPKDPTVSFVSGIESAAWSKDGKRILVSYSIDDYRRSTLQIVNADGSIGKDITPSPGGHISHAIWSLDGQRVVFRYDSEGQACVFILDSEGGQLRKLNQCEYQDHPRYWSVDGKWVIVYFPGQKFGPGADFYALEVDGNQRVPVSQLSVAGFFNERYLPWRTINKPSCVMSAQPGVIEWNDFWFCQ